MKPKIYVYPPLELVKRTIHTNEYFSESDIIEATYNTIKELFFINKVKGDSMELYEAKTNHYDGQTFQGINGHIPNNGLFVKKEYYDKLQYKLDKYEKALKIISKKAIEPISMIIATKALKE